jgi:hypothetical protein
MVDSNHKPKPWHVLALRANYHLGVARLLLGIALDGDLAETAANQMRCIEEEVAAAQDCVRSIAGIEAPLTGH